MQVDHLLELLELDFIHTCTNDVFVAKFLKDFTPENMRAGSGGIGILTFNYDIGLEMALSHQGINFDYCLDMQRAGEDAIKLLKLQGSTNWGRQKDNSGEIRGASEKGKTKNENEEKG
jgi:hypothetical protein